MAMMRKTITIPDSMEEWIKSQIASGRYGNDSEYFRDLIRRDQDNRMSYSELSFLIKEGLDSGVSSNNVNDVIKNVENRLQLNGKLPTNQ